MDDVVTKKKNTHTELKQKAVSQAREGLEPMTTGLPGEVTSEANFCAADFFSRFRRVTEHSLFKTLCPRRTKQQRARIFLNPWFLSECRTKDPNLPADAPQLRCIIWPRISENSYIRASERERRLFAQRNKMVSGKTCCKKRNIKRLILVQLILITTRGNAVISEKEAPKASVVQLACRLY